jgi:Tol biopolymer transport system component
MIGRTAHLTAAALTGAAIALCSMSRPAAQPAGPQIFAPGIVSTEAPEFAVAFSPDGREVYFNRATPDRRSFPIFRSERRGTSWSAAAPVPFAADGRRPDPFVTPDGTRLYFCSARLTGSGEPAPDMDIWYVEREGRAWGHPVNAGAPINSDKNETFVSVSRDGALYFSSDRAGTGEIYRADPAGAGYKTPERLPDVVNAGGASNPLISPDGRRLFFVSTRDGGQGAADLYVSERANGEWTPPRNLGPGVNSPQADFAPAVSPDGRRLYFTSERPGIIKDPGAGRPPGDIYWVDLAAIIR